MAQRSFYVPLVTFALALFYARCQIKDMEIKMNQGQCSKAINGQDWEVGFEPKVHQLG